MKVPSAYTLIICLAGAAAAQEAPPAQTPADGGGSDRYGFADVQPLLVRYCHSCHGGDPAEAGLNLAAMEGDMETAAGRRLWKHAGDRVRAGEMPPEEPRPSPEERRRIARWIDDLMGQPGDGGRRDPGEAVIRRLNRAEYDNTVSDLFRVYRGGGYFDPQRGMPEEVRLVLHRNQREFLVDLPADDVGYGYDNIGEVLTLPPLLLEKYLAAAAFIVEGGPVDRRRQKTSPGERPQGTIRLFDRLPRGDNADDVAGEYLRSLMRRAFRRPVADEEADRYFALYEAAAADGGPLAEALQAPVQAVLVSPHFLFRVEGRNDPPDAPAVVPVGDYELASRLSYFLWGTMPDDELLRAAGAGELSDAAGLERQARRMLRGRFAKSLSESFAIQWLQLADLRSAAPDPDRFPHFTRQKYPTEAMRQEALLLFETVMVEDRSVLELVNGDFTWLNSTLAEYYGIEPQLTGQNSSLYWHRYELDDERRGGVLTLGGVLTATSNPTRTSPVKRGKWVLETLLGAPPPPPLPDVADLEETGGESEGTTLRGKLQQHRSLEQCAACHRRMDPLGLALENYDAVGAWREEEAGSEIDAAATLLDGTGFRGPVELKQLIAGERAESFVRCLAGHMMTYALGRKLEYYDDATLAEIERAVAADDYRFSRLVVEIVKSYPFRYRRTKNWKEEE